MDTTEHFYVWEGLNEDEVEPEYLLYFLTKRYLRVRSLFLFLCTKAPFFRVLFLFFNINREKGENPLQPLATVKLTRSYMPLRNWEGLIKDEIESGYLFF